MTRRQAAAAAIVGVLLLGIGTPASAHRLDEYLQATTISVSKDSIQAQIRLTPGVAVARAVLAGIDTDADGVLSAAEQQAYTQQVLRDLSLRVDSDRLRLQPVSWTFATTDEMRQGLGDIVIDFHADAPRGVGSRRLIFENHHQSRISVYLVNCLVPTDPAISITAQDRNFQQSYYQLDYVQVRPSLPPSSPTGWASVGASLAVVALLVLISVAWVWRRRGGGLRGLLVLAVLLTAWPAQAHPLSLSYVDLRLGQNGIDASVEAQAVDMAHDLPRLSPTMLLTPETLLAHQQEVAALLTSRLTLSVLGKTLPPHVEGLAPMPDHQGVRLRLRYVWREQPASLHIRCQLFPYHPRAQTFLDIYDGQALTREMIFDSHAPQQDYVRGSRQSIASVIRQFLLQGIVHIFTGPDHILFVVGLLMLGGTIKQLLKIVTAFTVAHSVTLALAAWNIFSPPARIIEPAIALSIVFVGLHSLTLRKTPPGAKPPPDARLLFAFGFGFIHGFGFADALRDLELPRQALATAVFSFNLGVECGQACIVLLVAPLLALLHRKNHRAAQRFVTVGSLAVVAAGVFWFFQRVLM